MDRLRSITVVTPTFNAERFVAATVKSVVQQDAVASGRVRLQYILQDGGSTDATVELAAEAAGRKIDVRCEKDLGMYDALRKAFLIAEGDIVYYINAGDYLLPGAFDTVIDIFEQHEVNWLSGMVALCNEASQITDVRLPPRYRRRVITAGQCGLTAPWIQQEAVFWRRSLLELVDFDRLASFKLAGDYYLWYCFAKAHQLMIAQAALGVFRYHAGQLSENLLAYRKEISTFAAHPTIGDALLGNIDRACALLPDRWKKSLNPNGILKFNYDAQRWL